MQNRLLNSVTFVTFLFSSYCSFSQRPDLGTAGNFVLFTSSGAITNTGTSHLTGDVGTNSGSSTGFGNVNGVMHDNDDSSGQAAADLLTAYNQLDTISPTFFPASLLGNGDTLIAGVYSIPEVATLSGNLFLDAQGNADAVFIFHIEAAFSTNAASKVRLINGTQACNVFWKVEGLVSMASETFMSGTIVVHNAAINMSVNDTLEGRALVIAGAVALNGIMAYIPAGCGRPALTGPVAPDLLSTECYALFSGNGSVTNSGTTYITGDVGTNVGLTTGFDSLNVNGKIHTIPDGSTAAAAADLLNVYTYLNTLPEDIELLYPEQFGRNLVLTPHTYIMKAATTLTDTLYLNAEGDSNAVFVIKINGALSTSTYAKVILMNAAQARNVYWKIDGATDLNDYTVFKGTVIGNNGAISLKTGTSLEGRALTTNGAFITSAINATITSPCNRPLPIKWLYFRGKPGVKDIVLEWGTTDEIDNGFFTIEKSRDGGIFEVLTTVNAGKGTKAAEYYYSFPDRLPYGLGYYRISQTDKDGQKSYYRTIQVKINLSESITALPHVSQSYVYVKMSGAMPGSGFIELLSINGQKIHSQNITLTTGTSTYKVDKALNKGMYLLHIKGAGKKLYQGRVVVL